MDASDVRQYLETSYRKAKGGNIPPDVVEFVSMWETKVAKDAIQAVADALALLEAQGYTVTKP